MKLLLVTAVAILFSFVYEYNAGDHNIGMLPADMWNYDCDEETVDKDVPPFLLICILDEKEQCAANVSAPFLYWLTCVAKMQYTSIIASRCVEGDYDKCNITCSGDPARVIYQPLYHPDEKIRMYPEIFDQIRNVSRDYIKGYVKMMSKTFNNMYYSTLYNYQWLNEE